MCNINLFDLKLGLLHDCENSLAVFEDKIEVLCEFLFLDLLILLWVILIMDKHWKECCDVIRTDVIEEVREE